MRIADFILIGLVILWAILAVLFIINKKKDGKCIGCSGSDGTSCSKCDADLKKK